MSEIDEAITIINELVPASEKGENSFRYIEIFARSRDEALSPNTRSYLNVVGDVVSYHFRSENLNNPFSATFQTPDGRSGMPSDLEDDDLTKLEILCDHLLSIELKARVYDVLWIRRKKPKYAEDAIATYLLCAEKCFDLTDWPFCVQCAERALKLGNLFKKSKPELFQSASDLLLNWIKQHSNSDKLFLTARSIDLLCQFNSGDPIELYNYAVTKAKSTDFHCAEEYWNIAVKCARRANDVEKVNSAQSSLAECYANNANLHVESGLVAAHWMQQAVEAYRNVSGSKERREELYKELLKYQKASLSEMKKVGQTIDISEIITSTVKLMEGRKARDAIFTFAFKLIHPLDYTNIEQRAIELAKKFPLSSLLGNLHLDEEGRVITKSDGLIASAGKISHREIYRLASYEHNLVVSGQIIPAIEVINMEHSITENDLYSIVTNNPFVEQGQELLYAKGLNAGFQGDFVIAISILIPLLENSIRYILEKAGVRISTLTPEGIQEVSRMNSLLDNEKTIQIFGKDTVSDLKGILIDRTYGNLRNKVSHGLVSINTFLQPCAIYLWWLILRLCLTPHFKSWSEEKTEGT